MFTSLSDERRLLSMSLHVGEGLSESDLASILESIDQQAAWLARAAPDAFVTTLLLVETENGPTVAQRKRIGEASKKIPRTVQVLVTRSALVRALMTAIRWFSPANRDRVHETFGTYEEARAWLVQRTDHPGAVLDSMHRELREKIRAARSVRTP